MTQALILRDRSVQVSDDDKAIAQRVLEQALRGIDELNHKRWCFNLRKLMSMEHGEIAEVGTKIPRSGPFHRYHMAMEQSVFKAQDKFEHFNMFRNWLKIGAAHVDWLPGPDGVMVPVPKSISYPELEEAEMREVHAHMVAFLRGNYAPGFLWPHLAGNKPFEMMESVLADFDR